MYDTYYLTTDDGFCLGFTNVMGPSIIRMTNDFLREKGMKMQWIHEREIK